VRYVHTNHDAGELRGRQAESADSVDVEQFVIAPEHVRDDGRSRPKER